jgi:hypothetical protein
MEKKQLAALAITLFACFGHAAATETSSAQANAAIIVSPDQRFNVLENNQGAYLSPFTSDGVTAEWVQKAINAKLGASIGSAAGTYAGQKALEQVPFIGGFLGQRMGKAAGRRIALETAGGEAFIRQTSDLSFNSLSDMAGWLSAIHGTNPKFSEVMDATYQIYPELQQAYLSALSGH